MIVFRASVFAAACSVAWSQSLQTASTRADVVVIGAGISGLSAALEAGRAGARVTVIDMASVFGGHAVMSEGGVFVVDSPLHRQAGLQDSPELAFSDMVNWGETVNEDWALYYVRNCRTEVHDWLVELGVNFTQLRPIPGNTVPRFHETRGRGLGLVAPIYAACLALENVRFAWNTRMVSLKTDGGRIIGVDTTNLRTGRTEAFFGTVILATGGFQGNERMVKEHWPKTLPVPARILIGSGFNSVGDGHRIAMDAGAAGFNLSQFWQYPWGLPDPRDETGTRGLSFRNPAGVWVNMAGRRFTNERASPKFTYPAVLHQAEASYWLIFDEPTKQFIVVAGTGWGDFEAVNRMLLRNEALAHTSNSIVGLARLTGIPEDDLTATLRRYNELVDRGDDVDFGRFGPSRDARKLGISETPPPPLKLQQPPFYALRIFPLSRKNLGGLRVDLDCAVLDKSGNKIVGLHAVGELTGSGGMNGKAGLEAVWLGPGVAMGRIAGRAAAKMQSTQTAPQPPLLAASPIVETSKSCVDCHDVRSLIAKPRDGFWHFEKVHRRVLEANRNCMECHPEMTARADTPHRINRQIQTAACVTCHGT